MSGGLSGVDLEVAYLQLELERLGKKSSDALAVVPFGTLMEDERCEQIFEAIIGTLRAAKKRKVVTYDGEMLLKGVNDQVLIKLLIPPPKNVQAARVNFFGSAPPPPPPDEPPEPTSPSKVAAFRASFGRPVHNVDQPGGLPQTTPPPKEPHRRGTRVADLASAFSPSYQKEEVPLSPEAWVKALGDDGIPRLTLSEVVALGKPEFQAMTPEQLSQFLTNFETDLSDSQKLALLDVIDNLDDDDDDDDEESPDRESRGEAAAAAAAEAQVALERMAAEKERQRILQVERERQRLEAVPPEASPRTKALLKKEAVRMRQSPPPGSPRNVEHERRRDIANRALEQDKQAERERQRAFELERQAREEESRRQDSEKMKKNEDDRRRTEMEQRDRRIQGYAATLHHQKKKETTPPLPPVLQLASLTTDDDGAGIFSNSPTSFVASVDNLDSEVEMKKKEKAAQDAIAYRAAILWIFDVIHEPLPIDIPDTDVHITFGSLLQDGVLLCKLINAIHPGSLAVPKPSDLAFKHLSNITSFNRACQKLGLQRRECFDPQDLQSLNDVRPCLSSLHALSRHAKANLSEFHGPYLTDL